MRLSIRSVIVAGSVSLALLGLSACGSDDKNPEPVETTASAEAPAPTEATEDVGDPVPAEGDEPEWANPVTTPGDKISSFKVGDLNIDVYQVGVEKATKTGQFVDPKENKPIIAEGDDIVFVNYVVTNNGAPIDLGSSFVSVDARYDNWPYMQGMDGVVDESLYEKQGVNSKVLKTGEFKTPSVYTFGQGQTFSFAENFRYEKGQGIVFKARVTPVDAEGKLVHDKRVEAEGKGKIS